MDKLVYYRRRNDTKPYKIMKIEDSLNIIFPKTDVQKKLKEMAEEILFNKGLILSEHFKEGDRIVHVSAYNMVGKEFPTLEASKEDVLEYSGKNGFYIIKPN